MPSRPVRSAALSSPSANPRPCASFVLVANDREWVARIRGGDQAAFDALFDAYYAPLCEFVEAYVGSLALAEECVQDVFLHLWTRRAEWHVRDSVRQYLYGAARNEAINVRHRHRVAERWAARAEHDSALTAMATGPRAADERVRATELEAAVDRAIALLPPRRREAYRLRWRHQLSHAEIAAVMGISVKTVEMQLAYALKVLRRELAYLL